jgi:hypothetical protein
MTSPAAPQPLIDQLMEAVANACATVVPGLNLQTVIDTQVKPMVDKLATEAIAATEDTLRANILTNGAAAIGSALGIAIAGMVGGVATLGIGAAVLAPVGGMLGGFIGHDLGAMFTSIVENFLATQVPHTTA